MKLSHSIYSRMTMHPPRSRWFNSKTKIPIKWHRAVRKKTALFWLEHKKKVAPFMWRVSKIQLRKKSPQNSAYWMTNLLQNEKVDGAAATPVDGHCKGIVY